MLIMVSRLMPRSAARLVVATWAREGSKPGAPQEEGSKPGDHTRPSIPKPRNTGVVIASGVFRASSALAY